MKRLSKLQIISMHTYLIEATGGKDGIRDEGILESSLNAPFQSYFGEDLYKTIREKAAKLCFFLIKNHPFIDGNKRIGLLVMVVFLEINDIEIMSTDKELIDLGVGLAEGRINDKDLIKWIVDNSKKIN